MSLQTAELFLADKQRFFARSLSDNQLTHHLASTQQLAEDHNFLFLASHSQRIDQEMMHLLSLLKQHSLDSMPHQLYAYYCCMMLRQHYSEDRYSDPGKQAYYTQLAQEITNTPRNTLIPTWQTIVWTDWLEFLSIPAHTSKIRGWLGAANVYRIALAFSNIIIQQSLTLLQENAWLVNTQTYTRPLKTLGNVLRPFSVLFFLSRLLLDLGVLAKHTLFPNQNEQELEMSVRLYLELKRNFTTLINDIVWSTINGLTNYSSYFGLAIPVVNALIMFGFVCDMSLIFCRMWVARQDYLTKKSQYELEIEGSADESQRHILQQQLHELEISAQAMQDTLNLNLLAAALIVFGFALPIFITSSALVLLCYAHTLVGIALYLSADSFGVYRDAALHTTRNPTDVKTHWNTFVSNMVINTVIPLAMVGLLAVSWQAALCVLLIAAVATYGIRLATAGSVIATAPEEELLIPSSPTSR
jgi:hypothetical protein